MSNNERNQQAYTNQVNCGESILPSQHQQFVGKQTELIKCLKKKIQQLNETIVIMEENLNFYELSIKKMGKKLDLTIENPMALLGKISSYLGDLPASKGITVVEKDVVIEKLVEVQKIVEMPLFVEKIIEKPVYVEKLVEIPIYVEKIVEKECGCKGLREQMVSS